MPNESAEGMQSVFPEKAKCPHKTFFNLGSTNTFCCREYNIGCSFIRVGIVFLEFPSEYRTSKETINYKKKLKKEKDDGEAREKILYD